MEFETADLKPEEIVTLKLRGIFRKQGYKKYKMSRFEEYGLYAANKDFLGGDKVITFTDLDGRLLALKPDVTLSIIKNTRADLSSQEKLYYIENVYRESKESHTFKEIPQVGLEFIGKVGKEGIIETVCLAAETLKTVSRNYVLEISHMDFAVELLQSM
ncbi:MAG TPA: ATP phosphoribosyltransferase regulatory subunit, partial [Bacillota bacterium]|nr:ATP phosphoribosyltransferase regulatory subunit [Bacillota bacterium]